MERSPSLDDLPPEVLIGITTLLSGDCLINLRLACRYMAAASEDAFVSTYFVSRAHLATRHGLQALVRISASPHLSRKLESLTLVKVRPHISLNKAERRSFSLTAQVQDVKQTMLNFDTCSNMMREWWQEENKALFGARKYAQRLFEETLENLQRHSSVPSLIIECGHPSRMYFDIFGMRHLKRHLCIPECHQDWGVYQVKPDDLTTAVLSAVMNTGFPLSTLQLCCGKVSMSGITQSTMKALSGIKLDIVQCFQNLTSFSLGFDENECCWFLDDDFGLTQGLAAMTNLRTLALSSCFYGHCHEREDSASALTWFAKAFANRQLRSLRLHCFRGQAVDFIEFLDDHKSTLEHVELNFVDIDSDDCWTDVISYIANEMSLTHVNLDRLLRDSHELTDEDGQSSFEYLDHEKRRPGTDFDSTERLTATNSYIKEELENLLESDLLYISFMDD